MGIDYTKKRTWKDRLNSPAGEQVRQIGPVMWKRRENADQAEGLKWSVRDLDDSEAFVRAGLMEAFPAFFEYCVELADAEAAYSEVRNMKKSDPPRFYAARDRLYTARHAVNNFSSSVEAYGVSKDLELKWHMMRRTQKEANFYEPNTFATWLRQQATDHQFALDHPDKVCDSVFPTVPKALRPPILLYPDLLAEVAGRSQIYNDLVEILQRDGVSAAITAYRTTAEGALAELRVFDGASREHTYANDGHPNTKQIDDSKPILSQLIRDHFKT